MQITQTDRQTDRQSESAPAVRPPVTRGAGLPFGGRCGQRLVILVIEVKIYRSIERFGAGHPVRPLLGCAVHAAAGDADPEGYPVLRERLPVQAPKKIRQVLTDVARLQDDLVPAAAVLGAGCWGCDQDGNKEFGMLCGSCGGNAWQARESKSNLCVHGTIARPQRNAC